jgi:hypothetical protein
MAAEPISEGVYQDVIQREDFKKQLDQTATNWPREPAAQRLLRKAV